VNIRIVSHINYEGDLVGLQDIVADFCEVLVNRGFSNDVLEGDAVVKSIIIVKENKELSEGAVTLEEFWAEEIADQIFSALPAVDPEGDWVEGELENATEGEESGTGSNEG
jgi:hypothetical protein